MCEMCHQILTRLYTKGLVSPGNIEMCEAEILKELEQFETSALEKLSTEQLKQLQHSLTGNTLSN
jgi:hypothetical protein